MVFKYFACSLHTITQSLHHAPRHSAPLLLELARQLSYNAAFILRIRWIRAGRNLSRIDMGAVQSSCGAIGRKLQYHIERFVRKQWRRHCRPVVITATHVAEITVFITVITIGRHITWDEIQLLQPHGCPTCSCLLACADFASNRPI